MKLRDYQQRGIDEIRAAFNAGFRRVLYQAPCGAGKTMIMAFMANKSAANNYGTMFMVHRQELVQQASETMINAGNSHGLIISGAKMSDELIQIASVQTLNRRIGKIKEPYLIVIDEAHHATARTWRNIIDAYPDAYVVGLSATPQRLGGQGLGDVFDSMVIGPTARELILQGHLAPYQYFAPPVVADLEGIKIKLGDYDQTEIAIRMDKPAIIGDAIAHYQRLAAGKRAIVYCASREHSRNTVAAFQAVGITAAHIDGTTPPEKRKQITEDFKAGRLQIISNVDLISEGYDCPGCEAVILLRPTSSLGLFIQQSMRGMRPDRDNPGKVCVILDHVGNALKHGLPDEDREWSLDGIPKRKKSEASTVSIKQCPNCFSVSVPAATCPYCGFVYPIEARVIKQTAGELAELKEIQRKNKRMEVGMCKTQEEVTTLAFARKYAKGWVEFTCKSKKIKFNWSQLHQDWSRLMILKGLE